MALLEAVAYDFVEDIATDAVTGVTFVKIHQSSRFLELGKRYLLLVRALIKGSSESGGKGVTCKVKYNGEYDAQSVYLNNPASTGYTHQYSYATIVNCDSYLTFEDGVELYMAAEEATVTATCEYSSIMLIDISNLVEGVDYFHEVDKTQDENTSTWQTRATSGTVTINAQNSGDWLILGHAQHNITNTTYGVQARIFVGSDVSSSPFTIQEGENATEFGSDVLCKVINLTSDDSVSIQTQDTALLGSQHLHESSQIIGIKLSSFSDYDYKYSGGENSTRNTTFTDGNGDDVGFCSASVGLGNTQEYLVIGSFISDHGAASRPFYGRMRSDNGLGTDYSIMNADQETTNYTSTNSKDSADQTAVFMFGATTVDGDLGTANFTTEYKKTTGNGYGVEDSMIVIAAIGTGGVTRERLVWNGSADTDLLNATNWTPSQVPKSQDDLIFNTGSNAASNSSVVARKIYVAGEYSGSIGTDCTLRARRLSISAFHATVKAVVEGNAGYINGDGYPMQTILWNTNTSDSKIQITCNTSSNANLYVKNTRGLAVASGNGWNTIKMFSRQRSKLKYTGSTATIVLVGSGYCEATAVPLHVTVAGRCRYTQSSGATDLSLWGKAQVNYLPTLNHGTYNLYSGVFDMRNVVEQFTPVNIYLYNARLDARTGIDGLVQPSGVFLVLGKSAELLLDDGTVVGLGFGLGGG